MELGNVFILAIGSIKLVLGPKQSTVMRTMPTVRFRASSRAREGRGSFAVVVMAGSV